MQTNTNREYRTFSEIWNFNRGMITKVDHAVAAISDDLSSGATSAYSFSSSQKILEIGCGVGTLTLPLASVGHQLVAVDVDKESIEFCRSKAAKLGLVAVDFRCGWLNEVAEADNSFDWIVLADVLEHLDEPAEFLKSLKAYLKPGGSLWISVPNERTSLSQWLPTYQLAMALKLFAMKLTPRALKAKLRGHLAAEEPLASDREAKPSAHAFRPLYFNYSLNDHSPHVQKFTFRSIQAAVREAGFEVQSINGGSLFYKVWPLHKLMDRFVTFSLIDHNLAQLAKGFAGNWWLVAKDNSTA